MIDDEYLASVERGRKQLTPELMERLEFEMSLPHTLLNDPERAQKLWERYTQARAVIGPEAAALMIRFMPDEEEESS